MVVVKSEECISCGVCVSICPTEAIVINADGKAEILQDKCIKCGACLGVCPTNAIKEE